MRSPLFLALLIGLLPFCPALAQEPVPTPDSTEPTLPADGLIRSIQPPREYSALDPREWVLWGTAVALPTVLLGLLAFWWFRRKKPEPTPPTPYQVARTALRDCFDQRDPEQPKTFAIEVSQAVRNFIEQAFHMPAPERTTEEFLPQVQQHPVFAGELSTKLARLLALCDLAKFARHRFGEEEMQELYQVAEEVIDQAHLKLLQQAGDNTPSRTQPEEKAIP